MLSPELCSFNQLSRIEIQNLDPSMTTHPLCQVHKFDEIKIASICKNAVIGLLSMNSCMFQPCLM